MNVQADLVFPTSIDLAGLDRDLKQAESMIGGFADSAASQLRGIQSPTVQFQGVAPSSRSGNANAGASTRASSDFGTAQLSGQIGFEASSIRSSVLSAIQPFSDFLPSFESNFNRVGATVERLAIRIDSAMRFPGFIRNFEAFQKKFTNTFEHTIDEAKNQVQTFSPNEFFKPFLSGLDRVVNAINAKMKLLVDEIASHMKALVEEVKKGAKVADFVDYDSLPTSKKHSVNASKQPRTAKGRFAKGQGIAPSQSIDQIQAVAAPVAVASSPSKELGYTKLTDPIGAALQKFAGHDIDINKKSIRNFLGFLERIPHVTSQIMKDFTMLPAKIANSFLGGVKNAFKLYNALGSVGSIAGSTFKSVLRIATFNQVKSIGAFKAMGQALGTVGSIAHGVTSILTMGLGPIGLMIQAASGIASFFTGGAKGASDLNETVSKTNVIFRDATGSVTSFADDMATKFGLVKGTTLDTASAFGGLGKSLGGLKGEQLADYSTRFTKLSADLSSFSNIDLSSASEAIQSGLAGNQSDTLRALGVDLSENAVKARAAALGIAKFGQELSTQEKFAARSSLITEGLSKVNGDLERTQGGAANQGRKLMGSIQNIATSIGGVFLPVITEGITLLNEFGSWIVSTFEGNKSTIDGWKDTFLNAFDYVIASVHNFPAVFEVAKLKAFESLANIGEYFAVLGPNAGLVADYIGRNWKELFVDLGTLILTFVENAVHNIGELAKAFTGWLSGEGFNPDFKKFTDGFIATAEKFPELIKPYVHDMSKQIAAAARPITDEVAARRAARAAAQPGAAPGEDIESPADAMPDKAKKDKRSHDGPTLGAALELGSKEAYSAIVNATAGRSKADAMAKAANDTAGNTGELVRLHRKADKREQRQQTVRW